MTILVTRPDPAGKELVLHLRNSGKFAWALPLIEFMPGRDLKYLPKYLSKLRPGDLIFLMSQQVINFANPFLKDHIMNWPDYLNYYAVGRCTALSINTITNFNVQYPNTIETSEELIKLNKLKKVDGKNVLILRGNSGHELLARTMISRGAKVKYCECYQRYAKNYDSLFEGNRWRSRGISTVIVTSGEMLKQLFDLFLPIDRQEWLLHCRLLVASERLAIQAIKLGWYNIIVVNSANNNAFIRALI